MKSGGGHTEGIGADLQAGGENRNDHFHCTHERNSQEQRKYLSCKYLITVGAVSAVAMQQNVEVSNLVITLVFGFLVFFKKD